MEYQGKPLNLELINDIVEIPSVQDVLRMGAFFRYITNKFEKPYVLLLLSKGKDVAVQTQIFDAIKEEYYREEILDAEYIPNRYPNSISTDELQKIELQLKYKHKAIEPDLGVLIQAHIYRQYPKSMIVKLKGDWYREGDELFGDVINWVNDRCILGTVALVNEPYCEDSRINQELYDLRMKNWSSRENVEDFLEILAPVCEGKSLLDSYEFKKFYQNLFQDPWTLDPTTPYAQERQSIIESLLAELQCGDPISADNPNETYEKTIADLNERIGYLEFELARTTSLLGELEAENDLLKHSQKDVAKSENRKYSQTDNVLFSSGAKLLWEKLQEADLIDQEYQPKKPKIDSIRKASLLAKIVGTRLGLHPLWEPFETLWKVSNLSNAYSQASTALYRESLEAEIKKALD